uniref:Alpha-MPP n=1 Tax=Heterorhabditis bacteriophora TaxID=37862 RepID=A0A1I7XEW0_HETBA
MFSRIPQCLQMRSFCTTRIQRAHLKDITRVPLSTPLNGDFSNKSTRSVLNHIPFDAKLSKLESAIRVASEVHYGEYCTIGLAIESGSRYEASYPLGTSHLVEKLAFGSTSRHSSRDEIYEVLEQNGGLIDCQSTRDTFIYAASCHVNGLDAIVEILANAVWRSNVTNEEVPKTFEHFIRKLRVGVDHNELVKIVERHFDVNTTTWAQHPNLLLEKLPPIDKSVAQYTGGEVRIEKDLSTLAVGTPYPNLAHVALGFEGVSYSDPDFVSFCVLQSLLGGGGSFSAGGPGKGMYTRLYTDVMNRCHWIYGATAYNHSYGDAGLFCIQASSDPEQINDVLVILLDQFIRLLRGTEKDELERAKIQLKSQLMMNLEIRPVMFEDLARQVIGHNYRRKPQEYMEKIDSISSADIVRIAERMLAGRPSLVGYGDVKKLASYESLDEAVAQRKLESLVTKKKIFSWQ